MCIRDSRVGVLPRGGAPAGQGALGAAGAEGVGDHVVVAAEGRGGGAREVADGPVARGGGVADEHVVEQGHALVVAGDGDARGAGGLGGEGGDLDGPGAVAAAGVEGVVDQQDVV